MINDTALSCRYQTTDYSLAGTLWTVVEHSLTNEDSFQAPDFDRIEGLRFDVIRYVHPDDWKEARTVFSISKVEAHCIRAMIEAAGLKKFSGHKSYPTNGKLKKLLSPYFKQLKIGH